MDNKEIKKEVVKKDKNYKKKDLIFTAIVAFLVGAIITATGFTIAGKTHKRDFKDFKQDGIQRQIGPNGDDGMQRRGRGRNNDGSNMQKPDQDGQNVNSETPESPDNQPAQDNQSKPDAQNNSNQQNSVS